MAYDKRIQLQQLNPETDKWKDILKPRHADINLSTSKEYFEAGAERSEQKMIFRVRWSRLLKPIRRNTQLYRIIYDDAIWNITGYDDYKEQHRIVAIEAVSYARNN